MVARPKRDHNLIMILCELNVLTLIELKFVSSGFFLVSTFVFSFHRQRRLNDDRWVFVCERVLCWKRPPAEIFILINDDLFTTTLLLHYSCLLSAQLLEVNPFRIFEVSFVFWASERDASTREVDAGIWMPPLD